MGDYCGAQYPENPAVTCRQSPAPHENHLARGGACWPNDDFTGMTMDERRVRKSPDKSRGRMSALLGPTASHPGPAPGSPSASQTKEEGMAGSFASIKNDPHNWPIVTECVRLACATHPEVSTNEVWDLLKARTPGDALYVPVEGQAEYTWIGSRGFMGSLLPHWARKQGLVGPMTHQIENRHQFGHSNEKVGVYPSLTFTG